MIFIQISGNIAMHPDDWFRVQRKCIWKATPFSHEGNEQRGIMDHSNGGPFYAPDALEMFF